MAENVGRDDAEERERAARVMALAHKKIQTNWPDLAACATALDADLSKRGPEWHAALLKRKREFERQMLAASDILDEPAEFWIDETTAALNEQAVMRFLLDYDPAEEPSQVHSGSRPSPNTTRGRRSTSSTAPGCCAGRVPPAIRR